MRSRSEDDDPAESRPRRRVDPSSRSVWSNPRNVVPMAFVGLLIAAGGRKLLERWRARRAIVRLEQPDVTAREVLEAADHGRAGLTEFFRLLAEGPTAEIRRAAGQALGRLWTRDDLVDEEEKQVATRGFEVHWRARRRYPQAMTRSIPITVDFGLGFLDDSGAIDTRGLQPDDLEWSARLVGTQRASLEAFTPWTPGRGGIAFAIEPSDFPGKGPHRLILQARVRPNPSGTERQRPRTRRSEPAWIQELPHVPFTFERDSHLQPSALLALADSGREAAFRSAVRLVPAAVDDDPPSWLPVHQELLIRNPPRLAIEAPIPCDLAHQAAAEIEGFAGSIPLRSVVATGQPGEATSWTFPLVEADPSSLRPSPLAIDQPGTYRIRVVLTPDAELGWASPEVRSVWPEPIVTDWLDVRVIRR